MAIGRVSGVRWTTPSWSGATAGAYAESYAYGGLRVQTKVIDRGARISAKGVARPMRINAIPRTRRRASNVW